MAQGKETRAPRGARAIAGILALAAVALAAAPAVAARPPGNDQLRKATAVASLPFADSLDTAGAKASRTDPASTCVANQGATVFYELAAAADAWLVADTAGSDYDTVLTVYKEGADGGLTEVACVDDDEGGNLQAQVGFAVNAGTTYYVMVGAFANPSAVGRGGLLAFRLAVG